MHSSKSAHVARASLPKNGETLTVGGTAQGSWDQAKSDKTNRSGEPLCDQGYAKRLAAVTARLALLGFELYPLTGEQLIVARWNLSRVLPSIEAAERFLLMVGGAE